MRDGVQIALPTLGPVAVDKLREMYSSFAALADAGTNLIVDDVLWHPAARELSVGTFASRDAWLIGVLCPIEVAVERERRRTDRAIGGAALFAEPTHARCVYDIEVDTGALSPVEAAREVADRLGDGATPTAFRSMLSPRVP